MKKVLHLQSRRYDYIHAFSLSLTKVSMEYPLFQNAEKKYLEKKKVA